MHDVPMPEPNDPRNRARTGFSFARFAIPALCGFAGRALYLDADMLVFADVAELWHMPFEGAKVIVQDELTGTESRPAKAGSPRRRRKQCSVMVLDCGALDWNVGRIVAGLDGDYDYAALMNELCILAETEISHALPFHWNSLERYEHGKTRLLHYTDMGTQPWVSPENPLGYLWLGELKRMMAEGLVTPAELAAEVAAGHARPSLLAELQDSDQAGPPAASRVRRYLEEDRTAGFVKHAALMARLDQRKAAVRDLPMGREKAAAVLARLVRHLKRPAKRP